MPVLHYDAVNGGAWQKGGENGVQTESEHLILLPCQIISTGRKIMYHLPGYHDWLQDFFAPRERIRTRSYPHVHGEACKR